MAKQTLDQHQKKLLGWNIRGMKILEYRMERVARIMLTDAQRYKLHASPGFSRTMLHMRTGNLIGSLSEQSAIRSKSGKAVVTVELGTNLTNKGYSYPRAHEYGLGKMPKRPWLKPSVAGRQDLLRSEVKKAWVEAYG